MANWMDIVTALYITPIGVVWDNWLHGSNRDIRMLVCVLPPGTTGNSSDTILNRSGP